MLLGLERGSVRLVPHQKGWNKNAKDTIALLKHILGSTAVEIQHVGSTALLGICAKPIIDIVIGVSALNNIKPYIDRLKQHSVIFRGEDIASQLLFVMGDFEKNTRTHHIHVVEWNGAAWNNYLNFRDYLNAFPEKARLYERCKQRLAFSFPYDRKRYTEGKQDLINSLLEEAQLWRTKS